MLRTCQASKWITFSTDLDHSQNHPRLLIINHLDILLTILILLVNKWGTNATFIERNPKFL